MGRLAAVRHAILDAWAVVLPAECSGCGEADRGLCDSCRGALLPAVHPCHRDGVLVWSALDYSGVARRVIGAYKDGGRTDSASALAVPLGLAVAAALAAPTGSTRGGVHLVTIPSSRQAWRARGFHPVELLLARAGLAPTSVLMQTGDTVDQVGLGRAARGANRAGSLVARGPLDGFSCVVVDDILTTGATILAARHAVLQAGGDVVGLATLAETRRRHPAL
ncbi:MAG: phosphoribosyltransferase family protein [Cryobacterium sp.]